MRPPSADIAIVRQLVSVPGMAWGAKLVPPSEDSSRRPGVVPVFEIVAPIVIPSPDIARKV
jgi:hypothetical protein